MSDTGAAHAERDRNGRILQAWVDGTAAAGDDILGGVVAALEATAAELVAEGDALTEARRKGHVTASKARREAAGFVSRIAMSMTKAGVPESDFPPGSRSRAVVAIPLADAQHEAPDEIPAAGELAAILPDGSISGVLDDLGLGYLADLPNATIRVNGELIKSAEAPEICGERVPYSQSEDTCREPKGHAGSHVGEHNRWPNTTPAPAVEPWGPGTLAVAPDAPEELTLDENGEIPPGGCLTIPPGATPGEAGILAADRVVKNGGTAVEALETAQIVTEFAESLRITPEEESNVDLPKISAPDVADAAPPRDPALVHPWVPAEAMLAAHKAFRSVSQIETYERCGMAYRLKYREGVKQLPTWALVGGSAFHACAEKIVKRFPTRNAWEAEGFPNRVALKPGELWKAQFADQIAKATLESGAGPAKWAAANKGTEGREWWDREGPEMVRRFVDWWLTQVADGWSVAVDPISGNLMAEFEITSDVGGVQVLSIIDLVMVHRERQIIRIVDDKTGRELPGDKLQLGVYREQVVALGAPFAIMTGYYDARNGAFKPATAPSPAEVAYRVAMMDKGERAEVYVPNTGTKYGCGSCFAREACPVGFIAPAALTTT